MRLSRHWLWILLLVPIVLGFQRLRIDTEVLDLLPAENPVVNGLKLYQNHFSNARELIITVRANTAALAEQSAQILANRLRQETQLVARVVWEPPWLEHPEQSAELLAYLWLNQPPEKFQQLRERLADDNLPRILADARKQLATSFSPADIGRRAYDPYDLMNLPGGGAMPTGPDMFASSDGSFRIVFVESKLSLRSYEECIDWLRRIRAIATESAASTVESDRPRLRFTGRPAFAAEISAGMRDDISISVVGTSFIIALLFWLAHRRWRPMLWLLALLGLILGGTFGLGGLVFGTISIVSMGFAAILLGLAVDYAVVHYQEALTHPEKTIPEIRRAIAPSIFWAATTTICAFLVLNLGGLPGLGQLGTLVAIGIGLSAVVMIFAYLPPLFPDRMRPRALGTPISPRVPEASEPRARWVFPITYAICGAALLVLLFGLPKLDPTADSLRPRHNEAYGTLEELKKELSQGGEPLWLVIEAATEEAMANRLKECDSLLSRHKDSGLLSSFLLPTQLWPDPKNQQLNRENAAAVVGKSNTLSRVALESGFSSNSVVMTGRMLDVWARAAREPGVFWPTNELSEWILNKLAAREPGKFFVMGLVYPATGRSDDVVGRVLTAELPKAGVWLSGWSLLGTSMLRQVSDHLWLLLLPMLGLVTVSLWLAFRRLTEILLSVAVLAMSAVLVLAVMRLAGWKWNLMNLVAWPLILGTGVDYSIFMQLALRRYHGSLSLAYRAVGRALLLCGGTAVAGFASLIWSSNAGMASLGEICALGIGANMLISVFLLPAWWRRSRGSATGCD